MKKNKKVEMETLSQNIHNLWFQIRSIEIDFELNRETVLLFSENTFAFTYGICHNENLIQNSLNIVELNKVELEKCFEYLRKEFNLLEQIYN